MLKVVSFLSGLGAPENLCAKPDGVDATPARTGNGGSWLEFWGRPCLAEGVPHRDDEKWMMTEGSWDQFLKKTQTYKLNHDKQKIVHNKGPLATVSIGKDTKDNGADGPEHKHESDCPGDVSL